MVQMEFGHGGWFSIRMSSYQYRKSHFGEKTILRYRYKMRFPLFFSGPSRGTMTSSDGNIFRVTGLLWGESTGHRWISLTKASDTILMFSLICAWANGWANNRDAGNLRSHGAHYDVTVMAMGDYWTNSLHFIIFPVFKNYQNTSYLLNYHFHVKHDVWRTCVMILMILYILLQNQNFL